MASLPDAGDEGAEQSESGIPEDGEHQGSDAAEFIADGTPEEGAAPAEQEQREEQAAVITNVSFGGGEAGTRKEFAEGWNEDEGVDDGVHAVESPAAPGGPESADLIGGEWGVWGGEVGHFFLRTKDTPRRWRKSMMGLLAVGDRVLRGKRYARTFLARLKECPDERRSVSCGVFASERAFRS